MTPDARPLGLDAALHLRRMARLEAEAATLRRLIAPEPPAPPPAPAPAPKPDTRWCDGWISDACPATDGLPLAELLRIARARPRPLRLHRPRCVQPARPGRAAHAAAG